MQLAGIYGQLDALGLNPCKLMAQFHIFRSEFQRSQFGRAFAAVHCALGSLITHTATAAVSAAVSIPMNIAVITF